MMASAAPACRTNTTTHFFREAEVLETVLTGLPACARVWVAGCASGDEAYTIAILARELGKSIEITASDKNPRALATARAGIYPARHLRHVDEARRARYFARDGTDRFRIDATLADANAIAFVEHDLVRDAPLAPRDGGPWDAIFCRHVLIYIDPAAQLEILVRFRDTLAPNGMLVLAASEWLSASIRARMPPHRRLGPRLLPSHKSHAQCVVVYRSAALSEAGTDAVVDLCPSPPSSPNDAAVPNPPGAACVPEAAALGDRHLDAGAPEAALLAYQHALERGQASAELYLRIGITCLALRDEAGAHDALRSAIFLDSSSWPALFLLGDLLERRDPCSAHRYLRQAQEAIRTNPLTKPELVAFLPEPDVVAAAIAHKLAQK